MKRSSTREEVVGKVFKFRFEEGQFRDSTTPGHISELGVNREVLKLCLNKLYTQPSGMFGSHTDLDIPINMFSEGKMRDLYNSIDYINSNYKINPSPIQILDRWENFRTSVLITYLPNHDFIIHGSGEFYVFVPDYLVEPFATDLADIGITYRVDDDDVFLTISELDRNLLLPFRVPVNFSELPD